MKGVEVTFFACPKPFTDPHIAMIQRNAIKSWTLLEPRPEIILFGDETGTAEISEEMGLRHYGEVTRNEKGTPLISDLFEKAQRMASQDILCYVNSDIILLNDFMKAIERVLKAGLKNFLLSGQRWNIDMKKALDFNSSHWEAGLRLAILENGKLFRMDGLDYFVFPRNLFPEIPPFAVGRVFWDNWMIWKVISMKIPVIDATKAITAVHQNHGYSHIGGAGNIMENEEAKKNRLLAAEGQYYKTLMDATYILTPFGLQSAWPRRMKSRIEKTAYDWLVYRTGPLRHKLGLYRKNGS